MKRLLFLFAILFVIMTGLFVFYKPNSYAQTKNSTLRPGNLRKNVKQDDLDQKVSFDCTILRDNLKTIHENDGVTRVNIGQNYESLLTKLMIPLNTKLTQELYDNSELVGITSKYNDALNEFKDDYKTYEDKFKLFLRKDCNQGETTAYYKGLQEVKKLRIKTFESNQKLRDLVNDYYSNFKKVKQAIINKDKQDKQDKQQGAIQESEDSEANHE